MEDTDGAGTGVINKMRRAQSIGRCTSIKFTNSNREEEPYHQLFVVVYITCNDRFQDSPSDGSGGTLFILLL